MYKDSKTSVSNEFMTDNLDCPKRIPFAMLNDRQADYNHSQTLKRLNERGGMSPMEIVANIEQLSFRNLDLQHNIYDEIYFVKKLKRYLWLYNSNII